MAKETAIQELFFEVLNHVHDQSNGLITQKEFGERMQKSYKDALKLEKNQMKDFALTMIKYKSNAITNFIKDEFENYYEIVYES